MFWQAENSINGRVSKSRGGIVVAGPGSSRTIPGIMVSEIVRALSKYACVTRIEVDVTIDAMSGLDRAPSLAAAHDAQLGNNVARHSTPRNARMRGQAFRELIEPGTAVAIAFAWPGIDNDWVRQFLQVANAAEATTIVVCASLPIGNSTRVGALAEVMSRADRIYVGEISDATELTSIFGSLGPVVQANPALSLRGRAGRTSDRRITTFLPRDNVETLASVLSAFDAIPEAWVPDYRLHVVMKYSGMEMSDMVASSYHSEYVQLTGEDLSPNELDDLVSTSSALGVADPAADSRAFSTAVRSGIATVVLSDSPLLTIGRGYVGGLLADTRRPASVHVAMNHALRLEDLRFPSPTAWDQLAQRLSPIPRETTALEILEPVAHD